MKNVIKNRILSFYNSKDIYSRIFIGFCSLLAFIIILTFDDYGVSWDEPIQQDYGEAIFRYYMSGMSDMSFLRLYNVYIYTGLFDFIVCLFQKILPFAKHDIRHLITAFAGFMTVVGCYRLGELSGGSKIGLLSAVILVLVPSFYGHIFMNPKDIPFAMGYIWSVYYLAVCIKQIPEVHIKNTVKFALLLGFTFGVRIAAVFVVYLMIIAVFWKLYINRDKYRKKEALTFVLRSIYTLGLPSAVISFAFMLFSWPWIHIDFFANIEEAIKIFSDWQGVLFFNGAFVEICGNCLLIKMFFMKLPEFFMFLIVISLLRGLILFIRSFDAYDREKQLLYFIVFMAAFFPLFFVYVNNIGFYDFIRHFLFILPPLSCLAAFSAVFIMERALQGKKVYLFAFSAVCSLMIFSAGLLVAYHPYQYTYFNSSEGGTKGADGKFDIDYWGISYKELMEKLHVYIDNNYEDSNPKGKYFVTTCGPQESVRPYLGNRFSLTNDTNKADFYIAFDRGECSTVPFGKVVVEASVMGQRLSVVKEAPFAGKTKR